MIKIIGGKYKNYQIPTIKSTGYRPTTYKFREALFNILNFFSKSKDDTKYNIINNARILDLYGGTGAFSFEALSRGASFVLFNDINKEHVEAAKKFAGKHNIDNINFINQDATKLTTNDKPFDIIFLDPPYHQNMIIDSLNCLIKNNYLTKNTIIILELSIKEYQKIINQINLIGQFDLLKEKKYSKNILLILGSHA